MVNHRQQWLLTINTGSSSLKLGLFRLGSAEELVLSAQAERIGVMGSQVLITDAHGACLLARQGTLPDHGAGLQVILAWLRDHDYSADLVGIGYRIVYGGSAYREPCLVPATRGRRSRSPALHMLPLKCGRQVAGVERAP